MDDQIINVLRRIEQKLTMLIGQNVKKNNSTVKEMVNELWKSGLGSQEIALALGISPAHASKEISALRKVGKNGRKSNTNSIVEGNQ